LALVNYPPRGLEQDTVTACDSNDLANPPIPSAAECAALSVETPRIDPDLARVVEAWPDLPEAVRAGITAMIEAAR